MQIKTEQSAANACRLQLAGRLDPESAGQVRRALAAIPADAASLTLDLEGLSYISLAGLRELLIARRRFPAGTVRLEKLRPRVLEALESSGFSDFFAIGETLPEDLPGCGEALSGSFRDFLAQYNNWGDQVYEMYPQYERFRNFHSLGDTILSDTLMAGQVWYVWTGIGGGDDYDLSGTYIKAQNEKKIATYIQEQLKEDEMAEQLTLDLNDPFTGSRK